MDINTLKKRLSIIEGQINMLHGGKEEIKYWISILEKQQSPSEVSEVIEGA